MELTKEQTLQLIINNRRVHSNKLRYIITTKTRWKCLECLCEIFVSYRQYGRNSIFCKTCYAKRQEQPTVAQYQYMRILKETQLKILENQLDKEISII